MKDFDKELDLNELEEVNGGLTPNYPSGFRNGSLPKNTAILNIMQNGIKNGMQNTVQNAVTPEKKDIQDNICPNCKTELRFDPEANVYYCTSCNFSKTGII